MKNGLGENAAERFVLALSAMYPEQYSSELPRLDKPAEIELFQDDQPLTRLRPRLLEGWLLPSFSTRKMLKEWWGIKNGKDAQDSMDWLVREGHRGDFPPDYFNAGVAWDMARVGHVARSAIFAHYLKPEDAWPFLAQAAKIAQTAFSDWSGYGQAYLTGRDLWAGERDPTFEAAVERLLSHPHSPWRTIPFKTPLRGI